MSMVWWGVQAWIGGGCVALFLRAIFPSYANIPNGMESAGTTTQQFLGFFIFWLLSLPTVWPPIEKARHLFLAKAIM
jgi:NCS1 family nucleobase:cation symporter-1